MTSFFKKVAAFIRRHNIIYHRRYDTAGSIYTGDTEGEPKFSYTFKGNYTISIGRIIGFFVAIITMIITTFSLLSFLVTSIFSLTAFAGLGKLRRLRRRNKRKKRAKLAKAAKRKG